MVATANRNRRKELTMAIIENTAQIPNVSADFHLLEIENVETIEGTKYGEPDVPETRIKMQLRVRTPGEPDESFTAWMSPEARGESHPRRHRLRDPGSCADRPHVRHRCVDWTRFRQMTSHNDRGWPTLVPGTAAPAKRAPGESEPPF